MTIRQLLQSEHSRKNTNIILDAVKANPERIHELMESFFDKEYRICQRAAWPVGDIGKSSPQLLLPYLPKMVTNLKSPRHDAVVRNTLRTWQHMDIPESYLGEIFEISFQYILDPKYPIAIRAFSMTVCFNIVQKVPELKDELILAITDQMENGSPGIKSRGKNILLQLKKL
ncbi:MAG: hypothetical protein WAU01_16860 [Saprospiraceae bacterium]